MRKFYLFASLLLGITATRAQNTAVTFDGINDYINCGNSPSLAATSIRTLECWVRFSTLTGDREILSKSISGQGIELLQFNGSLSAYCMYNSSNASVISYSMNNFTVGTWYHIAFTWSGTKESMKLYVDGVSVGGLSHFGNINTTGISNPIANFRIGEWSATPSRPFHGSIDEVRVWTTSRSASEIKAGMYKNMPTATTGLVAYYKLNEGSSTSALNTIGVAGTNGAFVNGPLWSASPVQMGKNALHFGNNMEQVVVPSNPRFDLNTGTVECWIKPEEMDYNGSIVAVRGEGGTRFSFHINTVNSAVGLWNNDSYSFVEYPFVPGTWYHVAFVCDGATTQVYINGNHIGETFTAFSTIAGQPLTIGVVKNADLFIEPIQGATAGSGTMGVVDDEPFHGEIDEVRIWNTQRTGTEINNNKDISLSGTETGLVAQYTFDQGVALGNNSGLLTVVDKSINNLHGTLGNFMLNGPTSNFTSHAMVVLPVRWTSFTAAKNGQNVVLQWQTAFEQATRLFLVERSSDGKTFTSIGSVQARGNAGTYNFTDVQPLQGMNYYRLKQVDQDSRFAYSAVCAVSILQTGSFTSANHQNGSFALLLKGGADEIYMISDISGRILESGKLNGGRKIISLSHTGAYIATVIHKGEMLSTRILVP